jgi:hypothetical protein
MHLPSLNLPCFPCPHQSACCAWGTSLTERERSLITQRFGEGFVAWNEIEREYRTVVRDGRCVFLRANACAIHGEDFYPSMCRHFPARNLAGDGPYEHDVSICPELAAPRGSPRRRGKGCGEGGAGCAEGEGVS